MFVLVGDRAAIVTLGAKSSIPEYSWVEWHALQLLCPVATSFLHNLPILHRQLPGVQHTPQCHVHNATLLT